MNVTNKTEIFNKILFLAFILSTTISISQTTLKEYKKQDITTSQLKTWQLLGKGAVSKWGTQLSLQESEKSKGIMLISPKTYGDDVIITYKVLALTPATVIVNMLSVSDKGMDTHLNIPKDYDGSIGLWSKQKQSYFFAFKNASHNVTPFVKKLPNGINPLQSYKNNFMTAGVYYEVEVGRRGNKLWLKIDGKNIIDTKDELPLSNGKIAIRLRGTAGFKAGCLIKEFTIYSK